MRRSEPAGAAGERLVAAALLEDRAQRDRTTRAVLPRAVPAVGIVSAQSVGIVSGTAAARAAARRAGLAVERVLPDGRPVRPGTVVLVLRGDARRILAVERSLLNLLMHASGVASATRAAVRAATAGGGRIEVWGTRKTLPGLRDVERAAIRHGGGHPHRRDLDDGLLAKTNHLALVPLETAIARLRRRRRRGERVEVEVRSVPEAIRAARAGADALLLDNRTPAEARRIVRALGTAGLRRGRWIEVSGGISAANIGRYATTGADAASLGSLTHSAPALPFHLVVHPAVLRRRAP
jgi:nicotinate-nucleotide pyrophosphorylase (carboxylating)